MDEEKGYRWETEYEKTWEAIRENEEGLLQPSVDDIVNKAKRKRISSQQKLRLGIMRHLYFVVDMSENMQQPDMKPSRIRCCLQILKSFLKDFYDLNPISQCGLIVTRNKRKEKVSELSGNPKVHIETIDKLLDVECVGEPSLQNSLEAALDTLK
ncbi:General transcription factor IIH subunit 2-like protein [Leptotrombidium deliense]|uniref:General transcription factor IIH subunit 2-like protein n=1 Tax=Leptotrombidium deliense TaxID=299467 RepID=A0A443SI47_9ACAR|nr:General transcription factor IIH subunit 2-like protein [Leptotrombidium deliense]